MKRRRLALGTLAALAALAIGLVVALWPQPPELVKLNQIQPGMTYDEVEVIMGRPHDPKMDQWWIGDSAHRRWWFAGDSSVVIEFDRHVGRVIATQHRPGRSRYTSVMDWFAGKLGL